MSEAPERIEIESEGGYPDGQRAWVNEPDNMPEYFCAEYVRADHIEELEAKLARAVEALVGMVGLFSADSLLLKGTHLNMELDNARTTLAELSKERSDEKGQDDE